MKKPPVQDRKGPVQAVFALCQGAQDAENHISGAVKAVGAGGKCHETILRLKLDGGLEVRVFHALSGSLHSQICGVYAFIVGPNRFSGDQLQLIVSGRCLKNN